MNKRSVRGNIGEFLRKLEDENGENYVGKPPPTIQASICKLRTWRTELDHAMRLIEAGNSDGDLEEAFLELAKRHEHEMGFVMRWLKNKSDGRRGELFVRIGGKG